MDIDEILKTYKRVAVVGGPVTGKSIVTEKVTDRPVYHSDDYAGTEWSERSQILKDACEPHESFVVAGIAADRAVRKGLEVDAIIHCKTPRAVYKKGQKTLKKQIDKRVSALKRKGIPTFDLE